MSNAPQFEIELSDFWNDPYPALKNMREQAPICNVPQLGGTLFTRRDDIFICEKNIDIFSSHQPEGLMNRLMGHNLMRKDGESHARERKTIFPTVSPNTVRKHWKSRFEKITDEILDGIYANGKAELCSQYAMPVSGEALKIITGLTNISYKEMDSWSQAMIDGIANYQGDKQIESHCHDATQKIDVAIDDMIPVVTKNPDYSLLSVMLEAQMPMDSLRANIKLAISGGQNEPRDVIAGAVWALLSHPEQLINVLAGRIEWKQVFDEYCRWASPIGMSPRRISSNFTYEGIDFYENDKIFFMFNSANHDEEYFENADQFDLDRDASKSIAFGAGPHFCAGAWAARALVGEVALPKLFERFGNLHLCRDANVKFRGWAFRGPLEVPVEWDN
jgi:cytochrome P450